MIHVYHLSPWVLHVPPEGNRGKYDHGDYACVACRGLLSFHVRFDLDHAGDCPGIIDKELGGS